MNEDWPIEVLIGNEHLKWDKSQGTTYGWPEGEPPWWYRYYSLPNFIFTPGSDKPLTGKALNRVMFFIKCWNMFMRLILFPFIKIDQFLRKKGVLSEYYEMIKPDPATIAYSNIVSYVLDGKEVILSHAGILYVEGKEVVHFHSFAYSWIKDKLRQGSEITRHDQDDVPTKYRISLEEHDDASSVKAMLAETSKEVQ